MKEELKKITYQIKKIKETKADATYDISIQVPIKIGWIERMKFIVETNSERTANQLHYLKTENDFVYFKGEVVLPTKALYHYYFSFEANHDFIYFKKSNMENYKTVSREDMWKLSVNFKVPEWAKGGIMYHIFVDRFSKGRNILLPRISNRSLHTSWDEDILIGPNENGLWNTDLYGGE